ncbi:uncharacterized protein A1O9_09452 [Exophiala aquamarina CBS 119918]|uniref:Uncharacterized protein n=1 Tax=Exophiala aquamarina CBS 119918 TaxID=1182545 RepID=A0A072P3A1_9EURO|nr:uncharacterized protein A1O9_09452 [Exophiala aquamarina CBS 119918]KEF54286.1 hypothetical protein A1O9_09452 [Exophiala aquamarina CBS 119918]
MLHSSVLPLQVFSDAWQGAARVLQAKDGETGDSDALGQWHVTQLPAIIDTEAEEWDDYRLKRASTLGDVDGLSMHPLAHAWAKDRLRKEQQQTA